MNQYGYLGKSLRTFFHVPLTLTWWHLYRDLLWLGWNVPLHSLFLFEQPWNASWLVGC